MKNHQEQLSHTKSETTRQEDLTTQNSRKLIAGAAVAGLLATGALIHEYNNDAASRQEESRVALEQANTVLNKVIILQSGVTLRLTPKIENGQPDTGEKNNIAMQIPAGESLAVRLPRVDADNKGWIAFNKPNTDITKINSLEDLAGVTLWANYDALRDQGKVSDTLYQGVSDETYVPIENDKMSNEYGQSLMIPENTEVSPEFAMFGLKG